MVRLAQRDYTLPRACTAAAEAVEGKRACGWGLGFKGLGLRGLGSKGFSWMQSGNSDYRGL